MSAYELKRLENIRQNQQILAALNIPKPGSIAPSAAKQAKKKRGSASALLSSSGLKRKAPLVGSSRRAAPKKPTRVSARLREKDEEARTGKKRKAVLEKELPPPAEKAPRAKAPITVRLAFEPEIGATGNFLALLKEASGSVRHVGDDDRASPCASRRMGIKGEPGVAKIVQERIYSIALHPGTSKILAATGSKAGAIGFWDATAFYEDPKIVPGPPSAFLFRPHTESVATLRYNPANHNELLSAAYDGVVQCMDMVKGHFDPIPVKGESYLSSFDFADDTGHVLALADMSGAVTFLDRRAPSKAEHYQLHLKKAGGVSVCRAENNWFATCSLENTVCVWDRRSLKPVESAPLLRMDFRRAVTAVNFHPRRRDCLVSTCYDDHVRIHAGLWDETPSLLEVPHNNQTGRWITTFKAAWDPKSRAELSASTVLVGDMNRGLDLIDGATGVTHNYTSEWLTAQPAVNAAHPVLDLVVSGNASGKLALWTPF